MIALHLLEDIYIVVYGIVHNLIILYTTMQGNALYDYARYSTKNGIRLDNIESIISEFSLA